MKSGIWTVWSAALVVAVALGCGGSEEPTAAADAAADSEVAAAPPTEAARPASPSAIEECKSLAKEEKWEAALEPCMKASVEAPSDLAIRHALQQAQAATEGS